MIDGKTVLKFALVTLKLRLVPTECVTDLDLLSKMIIFESLWTTFEASVIF